VARMSWRILVPIRQRIGTSSASRVGDAVPCRIAGSTEENPVKGQLIIRAEDYSSR